MSRSQAEKTVPGHARSWTGTALREEAAAGLRYGKDTAAALYYILSWGALLREQPGALVHFMGLMSQVRRLKYLLPA